MATDLKEILLDEISLEGLDGITIDALWTRLRNRPGFSLTLDDQTRVYLWRGVLGLADLEFYELSKPRPVLVPYNRFHHVEAETRHFIEPEFLPEDVYPVKVVADQPVKGSCAEFFTRKDVTETILQEKPSLEAVVDRYGHSLVIVASPGDRLRALIGSQNDPIAQLMDLSYCILERIGRSRECGEVACGKQSLGMFVESSKMLFYQMKKLRGLSVVKKQRMCAIRKPTNVKVTLSLFHLTRFYKPIINKTHTEIVALAKLLTTKPEQMEIVLKVKQELKLYDKNFKKAAQTSNQAGERLFEFIDIRYREVHPNATPKDYLLKNGRQEKTIRHIRLLKPLREIERRLEAYQSSDDEEEEEDEKVESTGAPHLVFNREFDKPYILQALEMIRASGSRGLSMVELMRILATTKLSIRRVCNYLHRLHYITTVLINKGRQKEVMYVACENIEDNKILQSAKAESEKFGNITLEEFKAAPHRSRRQLLQQQAAEKLNSQKKPELQLTSENPSEQKICAIKEELEKLEEQSQINIKPPSQAKIDTVRVLTEDGTFVKVKVEEMDMMGPEYRKSDKDAIGLKRFGKMITDVHIRRANWIVEVVFAVRVVENFKLIRLLRNRERDMNVTYMMDQKSLKRLVVALVQEKRIRCFYAWITMGTRQREFKYLCEPKVKPQDPELTRAIEQAKLRYFSVTKEDLKKKAKLLTTPPKKESANESGVPQTAKESVQKHNKVRHALLVGKDALPMKYNRKAGSGYGLLPKMLRIQAAHQLLWHVCYDTHGQEIFDTSELVATILNPKPGAFRTGHKKGGKRKCGNTEPPTGETDAAAGGKKQKIWTGTEEAEKETTQKDIGEVNQAVAMVTTVGIVTEKEKAAVTDAGGTGSMRDESGEKMETSNTVEVQDTGEIAKSGADKESSPDDGAAKASTSGELQRETGGDDGAKASTSGESQRATGEDTKDSSAVDKEDKKSRMMDEEKVFVVDAIMREECWPAKEPHVYFEEMTWRRYFPPVPLHRGFPKGWCLISDILLNLPVSIFCQMVNVCYDIPGLVEILNHEQRRLYPVLKLPFKIAQQLLHSKKYIQSFFDLCSYLCEMGLLSFGHEVLKDKDQTFIYLHQNVSLIDTRESSKGYNKVRHPDGSPNDFPIKKYTMTTLPDVERYWDDLQIIALGSNLGYKSMLHADVEDTEVYTVRSLKDVATAHTPATARDDAILPGDRRGAGGFDSGLFVHTTKNWMFSSMSKTSICQKPYNKFKMRLDQFDSETVDMQVDMQEDPSMEIKGKERLHLSDNADKPVVIKKVVRGQQVRTGNKGGRGVKKSHRVIRRCEGKLRMKRIILKTNNAPKPKKKPFEKGDDKDRAIYAKRRKQRVIWSNKEDSVLLMCWLACLLMDKNRKVSIVNYRVMRDYIHDTVGEQSHDKTSIACARRLKFVLKNPQTEANLLLFYREAHQDPYIESEFVQRVFINTDKDVIPKFKTLTDLLMEKFQSMNLQKSSLPGSLAEMNHYSMDSMVRLRTSKVFYDVTSKEDICADVLRNILHSAVLLQDKQGRTHEMFKLLTQYPDLLLSSVIKELRTDGLFVIHKKQYARVALSQLQSGLGLRNFKVSQRYMYNYKHRNLSTLFEESADFLDVLCDRYLNNNGEAQRETLDFQPTGGQGAIIIPLLLQKKLDISLTLPQELVVVDMEGFYNFPWGRGKNVNQAITKADRSLQEMKKGKKESPVKAATPSKATTKLERDTLDDDLEEMEEDVDDLTTDNTTDAPKDTNSPTETNKMEVQSADAATSGPTGDNTTAAPKNTSKMVDQSADVATSGPIGDKEIGIQASDIGATGSNKGENVAAKSAVNQEGLEFMETRDKSDDKDTDFETVIERNGDEVTITLKPKTVTEVTVPEVKKPEIKKGFALVGKTIEEIKKNLASEMDKADSDSNKALEYTVTSSGTSKFIVPKPELVETTGVIPEGGSSIASRTLLSLRRAEDVSFEDIRVFNAQDNFVVNSCKIRIKLNDKDIDNVDEDAVEKDDVGRSDGQGDAKGGNKGLTNPTKDKTVHVQESPVVGNFAALETGLGEENDESSGTIRSTEEKGRFVDGLRLSKKKLTGLWEDLQRLLPFQLDMDKVWSSLTSVGLTGSELTTYKQVYSHIESHGVIGTRTADMQEGYYTKALRPEAVGRLLFAEFETRVLGDTNPTHQAVLSGLKQVAKDPNQDNLTILHEDDGFVQIRQKYQAFKEDVRQGHNDKTAQFWIDYTASVWLLLRLVREVKENNITLYIQYRNLFN